MAQDKITEVFDIPQIEKNIQDTLSSIKAILPELKKIGEELKSSTSIGSSGQTSQSAKAAMDEYTKSVKDFTEATKQAAKAKTALANASDEEIAKQKVNATALNAQLKEEVKLTSNLTSAYDKLNAQHKQAIKAYQDAAAAQKLSQVEMTKLKDRANELGQQLVKIDSAVGNYRRNVGNYSSAWNGLGNSINQISRELPNFAQSMQLGILAISNNLPILQDELIRAKQNIAAMKAEGKDVPSLFSQIAKSVFSWQTALTIGITVMMAYSDKIAMAFNGETEATKKLKEEQKKLVEEREQGILSLQKSAAQEQVSAQILYKTATDITQSYKLRKQAVEDLQKAYPNYFSNLSTEAILAGQAAAQYNELNKALLVRASLMANEKELERLSFETNELERQIKKGKERLAQIDSKPNSEGDYQAQLHITNKLEGKLIDKNRERQAIVDDTLAKQKEIEKLLIRQEKLPSARTAKGEEKNIVEETIDMYSLLSKQMNDIALDEQQVRDRSLAYLRTQLESGVISISQYEKQKQDIIKDSEAYILSEQTKFLAISLNTLELSEEDKAKVIELWQNKSLALMKSETDSEEAELKVRVEHRKRFDEINQKNLDEKIAYEKRLEREKAKYVQALAEETAQFIFTLLDAQTQKEITAAEKRSEAISAEYDLKRRAVDQASISEEEKTARKLVLDAEEEESQKKIDAEIRKIKIKQAKFEKAQALATIAINAAVAASSPTNLALGGALTPLILGLAAAQAAIVLATPLPEYAKGKKPSDSYEGLAIAGEKGTEMMIDKDGRIQMLTEPTLIHTRRGDTILSNEQLKKGAADKYAPTKSDYSELVRAYSYNTERTVKAIREIPASIIFDNSVLKLNQKRASR